MVDLGLLVGTGSRGPFHTRYMRLGYLYKVGILLSVCRRLDIPKQAVGHSSSRDRQAILSARTLCVTQKYISSTN